MISNEQMRRIEKDLFACNPEASAELGNLIEELSDTLDWIVDLGHRFIDGIGKDHGAEIQIIQRMLDELHMLRKKPS